MVPIMSNGLRCLLAVSVALGDVALAKVQQGTLQLGGHVPADRWTYLANFGYAVGEGSYSLRVRLLDGETLSPRRWPAALNLDVFLDEDWPAVARMEPCERARAARRTLTLDLSEEGGQWGNAAYGFLYQVVRPHIWYFAVSDCRGDFGNQTITLDYDFRAVQFDGSELSLEARLMPAAEGFALLGLTVLLIVGFRRCGDLRRSAGALHPVIWALSAAVVVQYVSQAMHFVHLVTYQHDGVGIWALDILAEVLFMVTQAAHATLLIAIAQGYTLLGCKECNLDFSRLAFAATLAGHAALVAFSKFEEGASPQKHHENDGPVGWLIVAIRLLLLVWFSCAVRTTREKGGLRLKEFMRQFELVGYLYFLAYPVVFIVAQLFAPYYRHPIMQIGLLSMQAAGDVWLAGLFFSRGAYFKASVLSGSLLPGGSEGGGPLGWDKSA